MIHPLEPVAVEPRHRQLDARIDPDPDRSWFRRLAPLLRPQRKKLLVVLVLMIIGIAAQVSVPAMARLGIDAVATDDRSGLSRAVTVLLILSVVRMAAAGIYRYLLFQVAYRLDSTMRMRIYEHATTLPFSYYDRTQSGDIISRANSDIRSIQLLVAFTPLFLTSAAIFLVALIVMLSIHVTLTLVALLTLPGVFWLGNAMRNQVFPLTWVTQARTAQIATIVDENINGIRVVKSFAAEQQQIQSLAAAATELRWSATETVRQRGRYNPLIESLPRLSTALVLLYGGWLAIQGDVSIGTLFAFNAYVLMLQVPFRMAGFILLQGQRARASAQRIFQILDERSDIESGDIDLDVAVGAGRIEFDGVQFGYGRSSDDETPILDELDFVVEAGETVAIVGRTGSGKSTIARLLARFYDADAGAITIDGVDIREASLPSLRHTVGMVADDPFLFSASLHDNIAYGRPHAERADVEAAAIAAQAHGFITELAEGYDTVIGERGYTLSGGQRQRVSIARALLYDPAVLILDDATSAIDVGVESRIHDALTDTLSRRTTLVIAHRLSTISLADRVLVLDEGRVIASGTHDDLLANEPHYGAILANLDADDGDSEAA